jgi:hypothetical protein
LVAAAFSFRAIDQTRLVSRVVAIVAVKSALFCYKDDSSAPVQLSNALPFLSSPLKKAK